MVIPSIYICAGVLVVVIFTYFKWAFKYWEWRELPSVKPSIPFGTIGDTVLAKRNFGEILKEQYEESKRKGFKHVGLFMMVKPTYMPIDLEYVKNILSKDFTHFMDRGLYYNEKDDSLSANLFMLEGTKWKNLRAKLTSTFSSGKMKMMFHIMLECGKHLTDALDDTCYAGEPVDVRDFLERFSTDVIGSCAFGIDCNSFKDRESNFRKFVKRASQYTKWETLKALSAYANQEIARKLGICIIPTDVATFFSTIVRETVEYREKNDERRNDFLQILIDMKNNVDVAHQQLTINELAAQSYIFFLGGFETSSTTMGFCLYELARNQDMQDKVRSEVNLVLEVHNGALSYDAIKDMKYMKQVIDETLRKYPPLPFLNRVCLTDYKIPGSNLMLEKGTPIIIPVYGLQHDPAYFPEPDKFDPERFSEENKTKIKPFSYMPFGEGPRLCIGLRFGLMQTGIGLASLFRKFRFSLNEKTSHPLTISPYNFHLSSLDDIWLNVEKI
ncbi:hypothetical protein RI129_013108 [Pyrocoelia pectoralis]|uniref:Cytochrome P450 n=1 Tax=Pyrocoelia pectoralis TaxID=417401 RepID=A0AAN7ZGX2_9COLE